MISIPTCAKIITSRGTLGFEHSEPGQDRNVAALRTLFDARSTLRFFLELGSKKEGGYLKVFSAIFFHLLLENSWAINCVANEKNSSEKFFDLHLPLFVAQLWKELRTKKNSVGRPTLGKSENRKNSSAA